MPGSSHAIDDTDGNIADHLLYRRDILTLGVEICRDNDDHVDDHQEFGDLLRDPPAQ